MGFPVSLRNPYRPVISPDDFILDGGGGVRVSLVSVGRELEKGDRPVVGEGMVPGQSSTTHLAVKLVSGG